MIKKKIIKIILNIIKNNKYFKAKAIKQKAYYEKKYSMKNITESFIKEVLN